MSPPGDAVEAMREAALNAAREGYARFSEADDASDSAEQYRTGLRDDTGEIKRATEAAFIALSTVALPLPAADLAAKEEMEAIEEVTEERDRYFAMAFPNGGAQPSSLDRALAAESALAAAAERERVLREALFRYGKHDASCISTVCTCGFEEVRRRNALSQSQTEAK